MFLLGKFIFEHPKIIVSTIDSNMWYKDSWALIIINAYICMYINK